MAVIDFDVECAQCRHRLRGQELTACCPGCSAPIAGTLEIESIDPESLTVRNDLACISCGYNLRTLHPTGPCPECGISIIESLRSDDLQSAPAAWLDGLRGALSLMILAMSILAPICTFCLPVAILNLSEPRPDRVPPKHDPVERFRFIGLPCAYGLMLAHPFAYLARSLGVGMISVLLLISTLAAAAGMFVWLDKILLTRIAPASGSQSLLRLTRLATRVLLPCSAIAILGWAVSYGTAFFPHPMPTLITGSTVLICGTSCATWLVVLVKYRMVISKVLRARQQAGTPRPNEAAKQIGSPYRQ